MKRKIKPGSAKDKGRRLQTYICQKISELTGYPWGSSGEDAPIESRPMGQSGPDVRMESQVRELFPYSVECKYQETWNIHEWRKQAMKNCENGDDWLLILRRNRMRPYAVVMMDANKFFELQERILNAK